MSHEHFKCPNWQNVEAQSTRTNKTVHFYRDIDGPGHLKSPASVSVAGLDGLGSLHFHQTAAQLPSISGK